MGVTIHYKGKLRSREDAQALIAHVEAEAARLGWHCERLDPLGVVAFPSKDCDAIELRPDNDLAIVDFVKTQFAGPSTQMQVAHFLRQIAPWFAHFEVEDEGEFFETADEALLRRHMQRFDKALAEYLDERPRARGPVRLPSGRWVDVME